MINNIYKKIGTILLILFCFTSCTKLEYEYKSLRLMNNLYSANESMFADGTAKNIVIPNPDSNERVDNISADSYFIASIDNSKTTFTKYNLPYMRLPMASLTKLMTALVVLENCKNLDEEYYVTTDAIDIEKDSSRCNLRAGDKLTVRDLLYGLLIPSGNDAANCLAENLVNSYDNFIIMMNNEAERLGALNTHFANPHGIDSEHHFTTAYDMFLITKELYKYPIFSEITSCKEYTAKIKQSDEVIRTEKWVNTNYFVTEELPLSNNVKLYASKTGNTENAGSCLALCVKDKKTGLDYISVVLNAKSKRNSYYNSNALLNAIK